MSEEKTRELPNDYSMQNDFLVLSQIFSLAEINYNDISQSEHLAAALQRWPLLSEFASRNKDI
ncbi:hypothetical protein RJ492_004386 [Pluralibacter gergoviae]|uniref:Cellulose biosynthesis protein BcsR n=1 Tax=Pluralibacter gergoviae TaxID=61647 RepID=A0A089PGB9_PLUGE|nr:cellulose biosynthesis protein BcsR [Pluralibacter gergoviae]AIQ98812.1 hypothetical protein LG71_02355 [Pluralibacter gergoviae]AVR01735.1 hypothetical protein A8H26_02935 [Pluralibacter gergoviae]EKT9642126.1 hypothetical protein [Pluralibacter gergoviae]EKV0917207.1 hypothetical protein [Pluralibacter gergoviae]EKV0929776.1 hypothetical protein [Pluralibacter gergoviae]